MRLPRRLHLPILVSIVTAVEPLLSPLSVGDELPWRLDESGQPQWLKVLEVLSSTSYLVRYPDGTTEILTDSE